MTDKFNEIINSNKLVLIDVYADWCAPCNVLKPLLVSMESKYDTISFNYINAEDETHTSDMVELGIRSLPTVLLYENGILISSLKGKDAHVNAVQHELNKQVLTK